MRMSKKAQAEWLERYRQAGDVYAQDPCGCVMFAVVDMPEEIAAASDDIARQIAAGREIKRAPRVNGVCGLPPFYCDEHRPGREV